MKAIAHPTERLPQRVEQPCVRRQRGDLPFEVRVWHVRQVRRAGRQSASQRGVDARHELGRRTLLPNFLVERRRIALSAPLYGRVHLSELFDGLGPRHTLVLIKKVHAGRIAPEHTGNLSRAGCALPDVHDERRIRRGFASDRRIPLRGGVAWRADTRQQRRAAGHADAVVGEAPCPACKRRSQSGIQNRRRRRRRRRRCQRRRSSSCCCSLSFSHRCLPVDGCAASSFSQRPALVALGAHALENHVDTVGRHIDASRQRAAQALLAVGEAHLQPHRQRLARAAQPLVLGVG
mmetsp:Transcript_20739/g.64323  ORF Transcript_20739/g.64323 Transcript_20739/m.64323 type:complete len:292 (+) Transcript_20739:557-1432(+)